MVDEAQRWHDVRQGGFRRGNLDDREIGPNIRTWDYHPGLGSENRLKDRFSSDPGGKRGMRTMI